MTVTAVTNLAQFKEIIAKDEPAVFDFWATWCGPCKAISPIFEKLSETTEGIKFYKVDTDEAEEVSQEVGIRAMPTFIVFRNGQKVEQVLGARPQPLTELIKKHAVKKETKTEAEEPAKDTVKETVKPASS